MRTASRQATLIFILLTLLVACARNALPEGLADYSKRIANALNQQPGALPEPLPTAMPRIRDLQPSEEKRNTIGMLEFLALDDCALKQLIAAHNSPLGKLAPASQRLVYELRFLQHAPRCIELLKKDNRDELARALVEEQRSKQKRLAQTIWQATLGGPEFRSMWQIPSALGDYPAGTSDAFVSALQQIGEQARGWIGGNYAIDVVGFERLLAEIRAGDAGLLHRALQTQHNYLQQANDMLERATEQGKALCRDAQPAAPSVVLKNIVDKFWIGELQAYSAALNRRYYSLHAAIAELESLLAIGENAAYRNWRTARDGRMQAWLAAPREHIQTIQKVYRLCGIDR